MPRTEFYIDDYRNPVVRAQLRVVTGSPWDNEPPIGDPPVNQIEAGSTRDVSFRHPFSRDDIFIDRAHPMDGTDGAEGLVGVGTYYRPTLLLPEGYLPDTEAAPDGGTDGADGVVSAGSYYRPTLLLPVEYLPTTEAAPDGGTDNIPGAGTFA